MTESEIKDIFHAQTDNVRELEKVWKQIAKEINVALRNDDSIQTILKTKMLGLVFCALAESQFSKLIHTPGQFTSEQIHQIKAAASSNVSDGWEKCIDLAVRRLSSGPKHNHVPNVILSLKRLIASYIKEPSLIRNKIAHGQWVVALNRKNTHVNPEMTTTLANLNALDLARFKDAFSRLSRIVEDIIKSPNKAHLRDYYPQVQEFERVQKEMSKWTIDEKVKQLKMKLSYSHKMKCETCGQLHIDRKKV